MTNDCNSHNFCCTQFIAWTHNVHSCCLTDLSVFLSLFCMEQLKINQPSNISSQTNDYIERDLRIELLITCWKNMVILRWCHFLKFTCVFFVVLLYFMPNISRWHKSRRSNPFWDIFVLWIMWGLGSNLDSWWENQRK